MDADPAIPSEEQRQRAEWDLLLADLEYRRIQSRWETPRAIAMLALAAAAFIAAARLTDVVWPPKPQTITIHFDQSVPIKLEDHGR